MSSIKLLEDRIANLEKQVYGASKTINTDDSVPSNAVHNTRSSASSGREKQNIFIKSLSELLGDGYLDSVTENINIPTNVKAQILSIIESDIREKYKRLTKMHEHEHEHEHKHEHVHEHKHEHVQKYVHVLIPEHIKNVHECNNTFNKSSHEDYDDSKDLNAHIQDILSKYKGVVSNISVSSYTLDAIITAMEKAAMAEEQTEDD